MPCARPAGGAQAGAALLPRRRVTAQQRPGTALCCAVTSGVEAGNGVAEETASSLGSAVLVSACDAVVSVLRRPLSPWWSPSVGGRCRIAAPVAPSRRRQRPNCYTVPPALRRNRRSRDGVTLRSERSAVPGRRRGAVRPADASPTSSRSSSRLTLRSGTPLIRQ
jgi:hypothetical protein